MRIRNLSLSAAILLHHNKEDFETTCYSDKDDVDCLRCIVLLL